MATRRAPANPRDHDTRDRDERGATGVEYALVVALMIFGAVGAMHRLNDNADRYYEDTSERIGALPTSQSPPPTGTVPPSGSSTTSSSVPPTTSTTPTTVPPTTTTTVAPTTTTVPPTTTTLSPRSRPTLTDVSSDPSGRNWTPAARVTVRRTDTNAVVGGATVRGRFTYGSRTSNASCTTASGGSSAGTCTMSWSRRHSDDPVTFQVTNVTATPDWDGSAPSITLHRP